MTFDLNAVLDIEPTPATHLLVMACSATKRHDAGDLPAIDRYDGPMWKTLRARLDELPRAREAFASGELRILVLSAQFGFIPAELAIPDYERLMTKSRADEICGSSMGDPQRVRTHFEEAGAVMFAGGELYRSAMWRASRATTADRAKVTETDGGGIGLHRAELGAWLAEHFGEPEEVEVETYRRVTIYRNSEHGFHASASIAIHFGYCDTVEEVRSEIDDHFVEEAEHYRGIDTPDDTPSLDTSFHDHEARGGMDPRNMTAEERNYYGFEPCDHVWGRRMWKERERLARIKRQCDEAARRATGTVFRGGVVSFA